MDNKTKESFVNVSLSALAGIGAVALTDRMAQATRPENANIAGCLGIRALEAVIFLRIVPYASNTFSMLRAVYDEVKKKAKTTQEVHIVKDNSEDFEDDTE